MTAWILLLTAMAPALASELSIPHETYTLDNGLKVVLAPDHSTPIVYVNVWYHVGSKDEQPGLTGFAHLFEHLMFQGSAGAPGEYFTPLQEIGGDVNGSTSFDWTRYHEQVPAEYLPLALYMESDRMGWLLPVLDLEKLDNQREVVRNERRQRYENPPYGEVYKDLYAAVWPETHPYHHLPIGSHADLEAADLEAVQDFFRTWYTPNNATLVISGDFESETAKELVDTYFGAIPKGPDTTPISADPVTLEKDVEIRQFDEVPEQKVWLTWISPKLYDPGDAELDLLSSVLAGGKDSRLYKALVKEQKIAKDISAYQSSHMLGSMYVISGTAGKGHTTDELVTAIDAVIADVLDAHPPTDEEIEAAKASFEVGFYHRLTTIEGKGSSLGSYDHYTGDPGFASADLERFVVATPHDTLEAGRRVLTTKRVMLHVWPDADRPTDAGGE